MTTSDLLYAIGEADESFVDEAGDTDAKVRRFGAWEVENRSDKRFATIMKWTGMAATFLVLIGAAWIYADGGKVFRKDGDLRKDGEIFSQEAITEECISEVTIQESGSAGAEGSGSIGVERAESLSAADLESIGAERAESLSAVDLGSIGADESFGTEEIAVVEGSEEDVFDAYKPTEEAIQQGEHLISSFAVDSDAEAISAAKIRDGMAVANGSVFLSSSLCGAIDYFGDREECRYRVYVELFQDGVQIANDREVAKKEVQRLAHLGYVVAMETCSDGNATQLYFTLHATADQVKNFAAGAKVGYALWLYDEKVEVDENATVPFDVWYGGMNAPMENFDGAQK